MSKSKYNSIYKVSPNNSSGLFIDCISAHIHFSDYRSQEILEKRKTITIDKDFSSAVVSLASWSVQFGRKELNQAKLSQLSIDFGIETYQDNKLIIIASLLLRDLPGDTPWSADINLNLMLFG